MLASLFYEPSTRTRLSFESAMLRLGGKSISSADPATSSAAKGETLADTVRVASNYADVLVIRHPRDGAVKLAATYAAVPVINGGDGAHEHPTQTLCDLFTLVQEGKNLKHLNVAIQGDLKGSRTIHSFVYALARFSANIMLMPAKGMELPHHVDWRLKNEFNCRMLPRTRNEKDNASVDAVYVTSDKPHQLSLISDVDTKVKKGIDAMYVTRFQKERWTDKSQDYPTIDSRFLKDRKFSKTSLLHPLPRVGELDISLDSDPRAAYFRQAAYGVPDPHGADRARSWASAANARSSAMTAVSGATTACSTISCRRSAYAAPTRTASCMMRRKANTRGTVSTSSRGRHPDCRCYYCETDIENFAIANKKTKHYDMDPAQLRAAIDKHEREILIFAHATDAEAAGFSLPKRRRKAASA